MDELIMKIIDIEDRAQEVIKDAKQADAQLEQSIAGESKKIGRDISNRAHIRSAKMEAFENDEAEKKCEEIRTVMEKQLKKLDERYEQNKDKWIESIVNNIIG